MVGKLRKLKIECMGNPAGTIGVCYETYNLGNYSGESYIFPNGEYCGFGQNEYEIFFTDEILGLVGSIRNYKFTNVIQLSKDFNSGYFSLAWWS